jgi:hypothetical protein
MKSVLLYFLVLFSLNGISQDTLSNIKRYNGGTTCLIVQSTDSMFVSTYPDGRLESLRGYSSIGENVQYIRYYPNGKMMWSTFLIKGEFDGDADFYNEKGKKIARFNFVNGKLKDTIFLSSRERIVMGRMTYYSVVHGGMQRSDGSSNVRGGHGVNMYHAMYTVKLDSTKQEQEVYTNFDTDFNGYFFVCLEEGSFGFFPKTYSISKVTSTQGTQRPHRSGGIHAHWSHPSPIVLKNKNFLYLELHYESVGYAP